MIAKYLFLLASFPLFGGALLMNEEELAIAKAHCPQTWRMAQESYYLANLALYDCPRAVPSLSAFCLQPFAPDSAYVKDIIKDFRRIENLALVYTLGGKRRFLAVARRYLLAWRAQYNAFEHAIEPLDTLPMIDLLKGYSLIREELSCRDQKQIDTWLIKIAERLQKYNECCSFSQKSAAYTFVGLIGFLIDDCSLIDYSIEGYRDLLEQNTEGLEETFVTVQSFLQLAVAAARNGVDIYSFKNSRGEDLAQMVAQLVPRVILENPGCYFGSTKVIALLELAVYFDPAYHKATTIGSQKWETLEGYLNTLHFEVDS